MGAELSHPRWEGAEHRPRRWSPWRGTPTPVRLPPAPSSRDPPLSAINRHQRPGPPGPARPGPARSCDAGLGCGRGGTPGQDCSPVLRAPHPAALPSKSPALLPPFLLWSWGVTPQVCLFSDCTVWPVAAPSVRGPADPPPGGVGSRGPDCPGPSGDFPRSVGGWGAERFANLLSGLGCSFSCKCTEQATSWCPPYRAGPRGLGSLHRPHPTPNLFFPPWAC